MQDITVEFFASLFIYLLFAGLVVLWFIDGKIKKEQVFHAILACTYTAIVVFLIKYFFPTLRPFLINGREVGVLIRPMDGAFPSGHTAQAFALAVTIFMHDRKVGWFYLIGALVIGTARVLANVHYPVDIFGGAFIGTMVAVVVEKAHLFEFLRKKRSHY